MLADVALLTCLGLLCAWMLTASGRRFAPATDELVSRINHLLPQTQCAQCGYPGCRPYAEAIATGDAINKCPPGGEATILALAELLGRDALPLDPTFGVETAPAVAIIREDECIGCTLCIGACPVDAIVGAQQQMHTVIASACTGCDLCREPCPVDCIDLVAGQAPAPPGFLHHAAAPCINCGDCATVCPKDLQPQLLFRYREDVERAQNLRLDDCIECRRCDQVCPSEIPLTESFRTTRSIARVIAQTRQSARDAEERYIARESRQSEQQTRVVKRPTGQEREALLASLRGDA